MWVRKIFLVDLIINRDGFDTKMSYQNRCETYVGDFYTAFDRAVDGTVPKLSSVPHKTDIKSFIVISSAPELTQACIPKNDKRRGLRTILNSLGDVSHTALDIAGLIPMFGEIADLANASLYIFEGDFLNASLSAAAAIPYYGNAIAACKLGRIQAQADDIVDDMRDITGSLNNRRSVDSDSSSIGIALPAFAFGVVVGAVGARKYWYKGLRVLARARKLGREKELSKSTVSE